MYVVPALECSEPVGGFGVGPQECLCLCLVGGAVLDDVDAVRVRAALRGGAGYRGEPLLGVGADPHEEHGGELLAGGRDETAVGDPTVVEDVEGLASCVQTSSSAVMAGDFSGSPSCRKVSQ